jgi:hypothetical protein
MKIKKKILDKINTPTVRNQIAQILVVGEQAVAVQLRKNSPNGRMTKMDALEAISKVTGTPVTEICEGSQVKESQK